jgi:hypothetical protein
MTVDSKSTATDYVAALLAVVDTLGATGGDAWQMARLAEQLGYNLAFQSDLDDTQQPRVAAAAAIVQASIHAPPTSASSLKQLDVAYATLSQAAHRDDVLRKAWKMFKAQASKRYPGADIQAKRAQTAAPTTRSRDDMTALAARFASK